MVGNDTVLSPQYLITSYHNVPDFIAWNLLARKFLLLGFNTGNCQQLQLDLKITKYMQLKISKQNPRYETPFVSQSLAILLRPIMKMDL